MARGDKSEQTKRRSMARAGAAAIAPRPRTAMAEADGFTAMVRSGLDADTQTLLISPGDPSRRADIVEQLDAAALTHPRLLAPHRTLPGVVDEAASAHAQAVASRDPQLLAERLRGGLVLDMDDTLIANQRVFDRAHYVLTGIYLELAGSATTAERIAEEFDELDASLVPELGYTPKRWRTSALRYAERVAGRELSDEERIRVLEAAEIALGVGEPFAGVTETLATLRDAGVPVVLLTKGERAKQEEKVAAHGFDELIDPQRIVIVPSKDAALLRAVAAEHGLTDPVVIGDSLGSDIAPANEAGMRNIRIDSGHPKWADEQKVTAGANASVASFAAAVDLLTR